MAMLTGLARVARDAGLTVREVPGWQSRTAHKGGMGNVRGVLWHHTATSAVAVKSRNNPTVQYMTNGLGYPLANYGLAWDGSLDVIAAGTGAHAGKGNYAGIPKDRGNQHLIGIEVEGTIGLEWSPAQLETAARLGAALDAEWGGLIHIAHYEWAPGRKTDPTGIPGNMNALRAAIKRGSWGATIIPAAPATSKPAATTPKGGLTVSDIKTITEKLDRLEGLISNSDSNNHGRRTAILDALDGVPAAVWEHKIGTGARAQDYLYGARMAQYTAREQARAQLQAIQSVADKPGATVEEIQKALANAVVTVDVNVNEQEK